MFFTDSEKLHTYDPIPLPSANRNYILYKQLVLVDLPVLAGLLLKKLRGIIME